MWKALILLVCIMFVLPAIVAGVTKSDLKIHPDIRIERVQEARGGHGGYHGGHRGYRGHGYGHGGYYYGGYRHMGCVPPPILY